MKIAIYESVHLDWVIPLAMFLKEEPDSYTFYVHQFMKKDIAENIPAAIYANYDWVYLNDQHILPFYSFFNSELKKNAYDLFWINTETSKHLAFALLKLRYGKMKMVINVHEINSFFRPRWSLPAKSLARTLSKKLLRCVTDGYIVNTERMKQTIEANQLTKKPCFQISPVYFHHEVTTQVPPPIFRVIIPGTIDLYRRDYLSALAAWKIFLSRKPPEIEAILVLAGAPGPSEKGVIRICQTDPAFQQTVKWYESLIPEIEFQALVSGASILLSPQQVLSQISDKTTEAYGITKNSGNTYDAIRHAKPFIIPAVLQVPDQIESSVIRYSKETELASILLNLATQPDVLKQLYQQAMLNSQKFDYSMMREKVRHMLSNLLKS